MLCEHVFRPLAHLVVLALAPLRVPPPAVVLAAATVGIAGAVGLGRGHLVLAALLVQLKTVLDNADGQLARLTGRVTAFGRYLDSECDLLVNAALFAALGSVWALPGFVLLTLILSTNFNVERIARGGAVGWDDSPLGRVYGLLYGWQDRLAERLLGGRTIQPWQVTALANCGMTTQLAAFGLCMALGRPLAFVWLLAGQALAIVTLLSVHPKQEVSLEHR
ncbi:MAG TPA: CDP-alcohol phosphatidyltransferase family protein [Gaiellaceae bacterium]|nr:CDP-alcohol phosphatidyltransferase family protein [Gaiellaceae bacterium]